ncbi:SbcC/MukB-like Walker B domain-containing protein [Enterococcus sp. DIV1420a]|uniref:SbcC/MukB-like Walker B domain-containing protein n=1 Tax=Enterococcus sp. DIV1420a TaxID=2774672 RepID=UPI003F21E42D
MTEEERNRTEGALFDSGILDSVISEESLQLADDLMIKASPQLMTSTLASVLTVNQNLSLQLQSQVANILDSIFYHETDPTIDIPIINQDGSFQISNLNGEMPVAYQASFIGATSQERYRQEQIENLTIEIQRLEEVSQGLLNQIKHQNERIEWIEAVYQERPKGIEVYQTYRETKDLAFALAFKENELTTKNAELAAIAQQWVAQMNELLQEQKNSSGLSLSINWKGISATSEQDLSTNQLVHLLEKPAELLSEKDKEAVSIHFQEKVWLAQEQLQNQIDDRSTLFQAIESVLDYRDWFEFELKYKRSNEGYQPQPLTDRRFNQFSGGEKAIAMYLPLFVATYSRYEEAGSQCPRVITLDEAFAGIDGQNIAELFKACEQLDFNYVMNSQALFGDYPTVSKLAVYELLRPQNVNFVTTIRYYWNGQKKHLLTGGEYRV